MQVGTCGRCGASLDWNGRCDCGMMSAAARAERRHEEWKARSDQQGKVGAALYGLKSRQLPEPKLSDFTGWARAQHIPAGQLEQVAKDLMGERDRRKAMGDERYYSLRGFGAKMAALRVAQDALEAAVDDSDAVGINMTWSELWRRLEELMGGTEAKMEPPAAEPEPEVEQITLMDRRLSG